MTSLQLERAANQAARKFVAPVASPFSAVTSAGANGAIGK